MTTTITTTRTRHRRPLACALTAAAASVLLALSVAAGPAHAQLPPPADLEPYTHPQRLVEVAPGRRLNLYCTGYGSPTVVLDSGFGNSAWPWGFVQPAIAAGLTRVCAYDRAGEGWSDPGPLPRTLSAVVADLHALLRASGESPPYVLVAHSWGGLNATLYAYLHPEDLVGLVLVDPSAAGQNERYAEIDPSSVKVMSNVVKQYRYCADLARAGALADPASQMQTGCTLGGDPAGPDPAFQESLVYFATRASQWDTLASEEENFAVTQPGGVATDTQEVEAARRGLGQWPLGALPLVVLQAGEGFSPQFLAIRTELLGGLAAQSRRGVLVPVPNSGHEIHLEQPQVVISAIVSVVCAARAGTASSCQ